VFGRAPGRGTRKDCHYAQVCLSWDFSKNPHGSTQNSLYRAKVVAIFPIGDISPKVATPLSVPLTVEMFACATSTAHYHHTCRPLYPCHGEHNYPKFSFNLLLMAFYDPAQEYQTAGWSQKITLHHVIMMGETYSRYMCISQYNSRALVQNYFTTRTEEEATGMTAGVTQPLILTTTRWPHQLSLHYCCLDYASSLRESNTT